MKDILDHQMARYYLCTALLLLLLTHWLLLGFAPPPPRFPAGLGMASAVDEQSQQRHLVAFLLSGVEKQNSYMEMFCFCFFFICFVFFKCMLHCLSYCVLLGVVHIRIEYSLNKLSSLNFSGGHVKDLNFPSFWALEATFTVLFMFLHHL